LDRKIFQHGTLNDFMSLTRPHWKYVRLTIQKLFGADSPLKDDQERLNKYLVKA
jgi:hypothetical protein